MSFFSIIFEPAILLITGCFIFFLFIIITSYSNVEINLTKVSGFLKNINKNELSYKFSQLDEFMSNSNYTSIIWEDFKKALIFPEKLYLATHSAKTSGEAQSDIYLTIDAAYFFNEDSLVFSKINNKFIQSMPTILTGLGPFFTFLKMAIAFSVINFSNDINISTSLNGLMSNIRIAALCSVFAVGFSLVFIVTEKLLYNFMCKKHCLNIQKEFIRLFDVVTSEKFLIDLVKESKIQGSANEKFLKEIPEYLAKSLNTSFNDSVAPYLENILYSLNKLNENFDKGTGGDMVDKLF